MKFLLKKDPYYAREARNYSTPIPSREYISQCLAKIGRPVTAQELAKAFSLRSKEIKEALRCRLTAMVRDGQLLENRRGSYVLVDKKSLVRGLVIGHKDGFGFLASEDGGEDIFLSARQMRLVFHDDRVLVRVISQNKRGRREGAIVEILERNTEQIVGRYFEESGVAFIVPANKKIAQDVIIPAKQQGDAKPGQLVVADIIDYPNFRRQATAKIVEILGEHMAPGMEVEVAIRAYGLPHKWSQDVLQQADSLGQKVSIAEHKDRKDLRNLPLITIDGEDARDFDDAVYCERRAKGGWLLYVAIADVSHYVKPDTALDTEALARGNSVYFPENVVPMLPEMLSNELCSLKPNVDRLCMVCEMAISDTGKITNYKFYEAVMCSKARLTYTQVAAALQDNKLEFRELYALFKALHKQRGERGAIEFETVETRIIFGAQRKIERIVPVVRNDAHRIIEECMLAANVCAAKFLSHKKIPALYRVHEGPDAETLTTLRSFLGGLGLSLTGGDEPQPLDYAKLLKKIQDRPDKHIIQTVLLRSMRQAIYDEENVGHFALAYDAYAHFTSPIRRYPDLLTHRAIRHAISGGKMEDFYYDSNAIHNFGEHCSMTDRRADDATYDVMDWLKCEYMQNKLGEVFSGLISSVCGFGIFIELRDIYVEGLIHITSLPNDYYNFDAVNHCLVGRRSGKKYCLGDLLKIRVARVDLDEKQIDFELVK